MLSATRLGHLLVLSRFGSHFGICHGYSVVLVIIIMAPEEELTIPSQLVELEGILIIIMTAFAKVILSVYDHNKDEI